MSTILNNQQILKKAATASTWSVITSAASKAIAPIAFIVLARILTPKDYGMVTIAMMVISFCRIFWDAGLNLALIQSQENIREVSNIVYFTNIILSGIVFCIIYFLAPLIAILFKEPYAVSVIRVLSFVIVINAFSAVQNSLFQKELRFKQLFYVGLIGTLIPGLVSIPAAIMGLGYWALVWGMIAGALAQLALLWILNPWRPTFSYDMKIAKKIIQFGLWSGGESLLAWGQTWIDSFIVASYLGTADLGLYRTGNMFVYSIFNLMLSPILPVLFSAMSLKPNDKLFISLAYDKATRWLFALSLPTGLMLFILQEPISLIFFSGKWAGISVVVGLVALDHGIGWIFGANQELYKAIGRPNVGLYSALLFLPMFILGCFISIKYGLLAFLITRISVSAILSFTIQPILVFRVIHYGFNRFIRNVWWVVVSAGAFATVIFFSSRIHFYTDYKMATPMIALLVGSIVYAVFILWKRDYRSDLLKIINGIKGRS
jgi:PST family polysaccharide transporter